MEHTNDVVLTIDGAALNSPLSPLCQEINGYWFVSQCQVSYRSEFLENCRETNKTFAVFAFFGGLHHPMVHQWMLIEKHTFNLLPNHQDDASWVTEQHNMFLFLKAKKAFNSVFFVLHYKCNLLHGCWTAASVVTRGSFQPSPLLSPQLQECWLVIKENMLETAFLQVDRSGCVLKPRWLQGQNLLQRHTVTIRIRFFEFHFTAAVSCYCQAVTRTDMPGGFYLKLTDVRWSCLLTFIIHSQTLNFICIIFALCLPASFGSD